MSETAFTPLSRWKVVPGAGMWRRARGFCENVRHRRTMRDFPGHLILRKVIEGCVRAAGPAPNEAVSFVTRQALDEIAAFL